MRKIARGLWGFALIVSLLVTLLPVGVWAQAEEFSLRITPSVSKVSVGDVIEYTVTATAEDLLALEFKLIFPEGLSYVAGSGQVPEGLAELLGWPEVDWTEDTKKWTGYNDTGVMVPEGTVLMTFCAVAQAQGDYQVELENLRPYNGEFMDVVPSVKVDSVTVTPQLPAKVTGLQVSNVQETAFTLTWDAIPDAAKYYVYLNGVAYNSTTTPTLTVVNRKVATSYNVQVVAAFDGGVTQKLEDAQVLTVKTLEKQVAAPVFTVTPGEGSAVLTWDATGITKTWIYMGTSEGDLKAMYGTTDGSFTVTGLDHNTTYYFQLAHSISGKFLMSEDILAVKPLAPKYPAKVSGLQASNVQETSFTLTWDDIPEATKYYVYLNGVAYNSTTTPTLTAVNRKVGTAYEIQVIAAFDGGVTQKLEDAQVLTVKTLEKQVAAPVFTVTPGEGSAVLTWDATGITKTWIYMGTSEGNLKAMYGTTDGSFTVTGLDHNTTYYFQLAHSISGKFLMSEDILAVKPLAPKYPAKVSGLQASNVQETSFTLTWDDIPEATKYYVYLNGVAYNSTTTPTLTAVNRKVATSYDVQVVSVFTGGVTQKLEDAQVLTVKTLEKQVAAPVFTVTAYEGSAVLTWDATGITKTWIYMGTSEGDLKAMYGTTDGSFTVTDLKPNTTYYFRLAHSIGGKMVMSEQILKIST